MGVRIRPRNTSENILARMVAAFPGLCDGEQDVNGGDLVEWLTGEIYSLTDPKHTEKIQRLRKMLQEYAEQGSPKDEIANEAGYGG